MKVLAIKSRPAPNSSVLGYIQPILKFDETDKTFKKVDNIIDFPNDGEIFIIKGYNMIDSQFEHGELFEIDDIKVNVNNYDEDRHGSCYYTINYANPIKLNKWEYIPIYETEFDLEKRSAKNLVSSKNGSAFFIKNDNYLFGPFTYDIVTLSALSVDYFDTETLDEGNVIEDFLSNMQDFIFKYDISSIQDALIDGYVVDLQEIFRKKPLDAIYFGTKDKIIEWGKRKFSSKLNDEEKQMLDKIKDLETPNSTIATEQQKIDLFKKYLGEANTWLNIELPKHFEEYLVSESGSAHVDKYLEDNKESFFAEYRKSEIAEKESLIQQKSEQLESLRQNISEFEEKLISQEDKTFEGIEEVEKTKLKNIISNEASRTLLIQYYDDSRNLQIAKDEFTKLEAQREYLDKQIRDLETRYEIVQKAIKNVKSEIFEEKEFAKKVIDAKIYTDLLNNIDPSQNEDSANIQISYKPVSINKSEFSTKQFIDEIGSRLDKANRKIIFNDLVNYLVLINQNFLTIIAGLPGVGKTSLVEKISIALGAYQNNRYLKIPVARGWTSSKDLIGYYNPLTKKYQSSKTDLYRFLKICENDNKNDLEVPSLILLDEANLSPMEHYWSEFLSISDFDYKRVIKTTEQETLSFGSGVRFLATINYDHTTEMLSDRLLSRAPIVKLNVSDYLLDDGVEIDTEVTDIFSMVQFNAYLNKNPQKDYFKGDVKNKFDSIIKTLQDEEGSLGQPIVIGMRKYKSVEKYCSVAGNIMIDPNKFTALDYAVNQYILPLINGRGDTYAKRLLDLKEKLQGLPQSLKSVNKIIQVGNENFKNYKFFC